MRQVTYRSSCPYKPGHKITLHPNDPSHYQQQIQAVVTRIFESITHSCVMAVHLLDDIPTTKAGSVAVLEVFDHRFAPQLREYWRRHYPTWSVDREREFRAFAREGGIAEYLAELDSDDDEVDDDNDEKDKEGEGEGEGSDDDSDEEEVNPGRAKRFSTISCGNGTGWKWKYTTP